MSEKPRFFSLKTTVLFAVILSMALADVCLSAELKVPLDRRAIVSRHNISSENLESTLPIGNGNFCFNVDGTGLQTFTGNTLSHWGWYSDPLPDAYRVVFKDLEKYDDTVKQIKNIDGVDSINDRREFANKLSSVSSLVGIISIAVVAALIIISIFIIANTIRATMYSRRFEISIMKSVGATNMFVRMPFLVEGMVIGFISAALSTGAVALLYEGVKRIIVDVAGPWVKVISFSEIVVPLALIFILVGVLVGLFGGFISIRKYLKKEGNEILGW